MKTEIISENLWERLTALAELCSSKSFVAVAYFGKGGASMLPLNPGSILVVDASEGAVKSSQTDPRELLKLYKKGVKIYSRERLHTKVFVIGTKLVLGSANVSRNSESRLQELCLATTDRKLIRQAKEFILSLCSVELGPDQLRRLKKIYKPPRVPGGHAGKRTHQQIRKSSGPNLHVFRLTQIDYELDEQRESKLGTKEAKAKHSLKRRHFLDEFLWSNKLNARIGDWAVQVVEEGDKTFVTPIGTVVHIRRWTRNRKVKALYYVELPIRKRWRLAKFRKLLSKKEYANLGRNGRKSEAFKSKLLSLWE